MKEGFLFISRDLSLRLIRDRVIFKCLGISRAKISSLKTNQLEIYCNKLHFLRWQSAI